MAPHVLRMMDTQFIRLSGFSVHPAVPPKGGYSVSDISPSLYVWQVMGSNTQFIPLSELLFTQREKKADVSPYLWVHQTPKSSDEPMGGILLAIP